MHRQEGGLSLSRGAMTEGWVWPTYLRGEDVFYLGSSNTKGKRAKGTVRGGVAVAADHGGSRESEALLRSDDVDNPLPADSTFTHPPEGSAPRCGGERERGERGDASCR